MVPSRLIVAAGLLHLAAIVAAHGDDEHGGMDNDMDVPGMTPFNSSSETTWPSYAALSEHSGWLLAHVGLMVLAWFFILPVGVMFSIARSRFALPTQLVFLVANGLGVVFGTIYNVNTPDLYENNAHHGVGWVATWVMVAQVTMSLIFVYSGRFKNATPSTGERTAFLPLSMPSGSRQGMLPYTDYRWSGDSGQSTEVPSGQNTRDASPIDPNRGEEYRLPKEEVDLEDDEDDDDGAKAVKPASTGRAFLHNTFVDKYLSNKIAGMLSKRVLKCLEIPYLIIDRSILILGFIALTTGGVSYGGIFRGVEIFSGLAHWIKGGIFFWYGLLTLGRWMGCFADVGWAWNVKPSRTEVGQSKARVPSAEFVESFLIFFYGSTNVFLEHLNAWGNEWSAQDLEHISITIMFFGGGLCGMLIESKKVREWLSTQVEILPARKDLHPSDAQDLRAPPKTYNFAMNPIPALIILLLGIMMSSHHQDSMVSTMVHKQWGTLLIGGAFARGVTYILTYLSPPTSIYPARPPSELISAFCLISGGLIFMASARDCIVVMERNNLHAMFIFTVMMGFTAFTMAWEILVVALKGWATRREMRVRR